MLRSDLIPNRKSEGRNTSFCIHDSGKQFSAHTKLCCVEYDCILNMITLTLINCTGLTNFCIGMLIVLKAFSVEGPKYVK